MWMASRGHFAKSRSIIGNDSRGDAEAQRIETMNENKIGTEVIAAAISVHRELGPGLLETEWTWRNINSRGDAEARRRKNESEI